MTYKDTKRQTAHRYNEQGEKIHITHAQQKQTHNERLTKTRKKRLNICIQKYISNKKNQQYNRQYNTKPIQIKENVYHTTCND